MEKKNSLKKSSASLTEIWIPRLLGQAFRVLLETLCKLLTYLGSVTFLKCCTSICQATAKSFFSSETTKSAAHLLPAIRHFLRAQHRRNGWRFHHCHLVRQQALTKLGWDQGAVALCWKNIEFQLFQSRLGNTSGRRPCELQSCESTNLLACDGYWRIDEVIDKVIDGAWKFMEASDVDSFRSHQQLQAWLGALVFLHPWLRHMVLHWCSVLAIPKHVSTGNIGSTRAVMGNTWSQVSSVLAAWLVLRHTPQLRESPCPRWDVAPDIGATKTATDHRCAMWYRLTDQSCAH